MRIGRSDVRKIGFPQDIVNADAIAQLDTDRFEPEVDVDLAPKQVARPSENPFGPEVPLLPLAIASFQNGAHPAQAGFGKNPIEPRKFVKHAGKNQVRHELCGCTKIAQGRDTMGLPVAKSFPSRQRQLPGKSGGRMQMDTHAELLTHVP